MCDIVVTSRIDYLLCFRGTVMNVQEVSVIFSILFSLALRDVCGVIAFKYVNICQIQTISFKRRSSWVLYFKHGMDNIMTNAAYIWVAFDVQLLPRR